MVDDIFCYLVYPTRRPRIDPAIPGPHHTEIVVTHNIARVIISAGWLLALDAGVKHLKKGRAHIVRKESVRPRAAYRDRTDDLLFTRQAFYQLN